MTNSSDDSRILINNPIASTIFGIGASLLVVSAFIISLINVLLSCVLIPIALLICVSALILDRIIDNCKNTTIKQQDEIT